MKKIILCLVLLFFTSACFDYNEINNIAILNGLGVDYQDNNYIITYELMNTDKQSENNDVSKKSYTITNEAPTLEEAILKNNNTIPKKISFENISVMVISQRIAKLGLTKITDYFIRDNNLTTNFYVVLTDDIPQKILNYQDTMKNINAETITKLITNSNANITLTKKNQLDFLMAQIKDNKQDIVLPNININNDLEITNLGVFKNDKINYYLNNDELNTYALLKNMKNNNILIENEQGSIKIYQEKTTINYLNNEFIIKINLRGKIEDLKENINVKDVNNINKLENNFQENIQNDVIKLIQESLNNDSDILGFKKVLALKKVNADWHQPYQVKVSLKLNRIGGLFEVIE